MILLNTDD